MVKVKCYRCGYIWMYVGVAKDYATCPSCKAAVRICPEKFIARELFKEVCEVVDSNFKLEERRVAYNMLANLLAAYIKHVVGKGKEKIKAESRKIKWRTVNL